MGSKFSLNILKECLDNHIHSLAMLRQDQKNITINGGPLIFRRMAKIEVVEEQKKVNDLRRSISILKRSLAANENGGRNDSRSDNHAEDKS